MTVYKASITVPFDGIETSVTVDVSAYMADAREAIWVLYAADGSPVEGVCQPINIGEVTLTISPAPSAGDFKLVGLA